MTLFLLSYNMVFANAAVISVTLGGLVSYKS